MVPRLFLLRTGPERLFQKGFCLPETGPIRIGNGFGYGPKTVPGPDAGRRSIFIEEARRGFGRA